MEQEWRVFRTMHPNVLMVGPDAAVADALRTLRCTCRQPVVTCWATDPMELPFPASSGTLILRDVETLSLESQRGLLAWLHEAAQLRTQVIATTAQPLWPRLETRAFLDALYYRLNVIYIDLAQQGIRDTDIYFAEGDQIASV